MGDSSMFLDYGEGQIVITIANTAIQDESPTIHLEGYRGLELLTPEDGKTDYTGHPILISWSASEYVERVSIHVRKSPTGRFEFIELEPAEECVIILKDNDNDNDKIVFDSNEIPFKVQGSL